MKQTRGTGQYQKFTKNLIVRGFIMELKRIGVSDKSIAEILFKTYGLQIKRNTISSIRQAEKKCRSSQFIKEATCYLLQYNYCNQYKSDNILRKQLKDLIKSNEIPYPFSYIDYRLIKTIITNFYNQEYQQPTKQVKCEEQYQVQQLETQQQQILQQQQQILQQQEQSGEPNEQVIEEEEQFKVSNWINLGSDEEIQDHYEYEIKENVTTQDGFKKGN